MAWLQLICTPTYCRYVSLITVDHAHMRCHLRLLGTQTLGLFVQSVQRINETLPPDRLRLEASKLVGASMLSGHFYKQRMREAPALCTKHDQTSKLYIVAVSSTECTQCGGTPLMSFVYARHATTNGVCSS